MGLLAHCGANWVYCDTGSFAGGFFLIWLIGRSVKRAEKQAKQRANERLAARAIAELAAKQSQEKRADDTPLH